MAEPCEHEHTHPNRCDDCGQPWCWVCRTYHEPAYRVGIYEGVGVCVDKLHHEIAALKGILAEHQEVYLGAAAILKTALDRMDPSTITLRVKGGA